MRRLPVFTLPILLLAPVLLAAMPAADAARTDVVGSLPDALVGAAAVALGDHVYVFGGRLANGSFSDAILRHTPATGAIERVATLPTDPGAVNGGRQSMAALGVGGKAFVFGGAIRVEEDVNGDGTVETVPRSSASIVSFDPATLSVEVLPDRLPTSVWGLSGASVDGAALLFGGFHYDSATAAGIGRSDAIVRVDPAAPAGARVQTLAARLPSPVQDAATAAVGSTVHLFGGLIDHTPGGDECPTRTHEDYRTGEPVETQPASCLTDAIVAFDAGAGANASVVARLPASVQFASASATAAGTVVLAGGATEGPTPTDAVRVFTPGASTIVDAGTTLPAPAFGMAAAELPSASGILLYGGRLGVPSDLTSDVVHVDPKAAADAPGPVAAFSVHRDGETVRLAWASPADEGASPVTHYDIAYVAREGVIRHLGQTTALTFMDASPVLDEGITYRVRAVNEHGAGPAALSSVAAIQPPSPPLNLNAETESVVPGVAQRVHLSWEAPARTGGLDVLLYRVYRAGASGDAEEILVAEVEGGTGFVDENPQAIGASVYRVGAVTAVGEGARSDAARVEPVRDAVRGLLAAVLA